MANTKAIGLVVLAGLCSLPARAERRFQVSAVRLGQPGEAVTDESQRFVDKLEARPQVSAAMVANPVAPAKAWFTRPAGAPAEQWLSLVVVGFGTRRDWLAFSFDGADGAAAMALRRPASTRARESAYLHSVPPGPGQVSHNAAAELAADVIHALDRPVDASAPVLSISVRALKTESVQPLAPITDEEQGGLMAVAFAAASRVGWRAAPGRTARHMDLAVTRGVRSMTVKATLTEDGKETTRTRRAVREDGLYDGLVNLFRDFRFWNGGVSDEIQLEPAGFAMVAYHKEKLFLQHEHELWVVDLSTGRRGWRVPKPERRSPRYAARTDPAGQLRLYRYAEPGLTEFELGKGGPLAFSPAGSAATFERGFHIYFEESDEASRKRTWLAADGRRLDHYRRNELAWSLEAGDMLGCGPLAHENHVFVGGDTGEFWCLNKVDGKEVWHRQLPTRLRGRIGLAGDMLVFGSVEGTVYALSRRTGETAWEHELGDLPVAEPQPVGESVFVASHNNTVRLLDPATGRARATHKTAGWPVGAMALRAAGLVVFADQGGEVVFLDAKDLSPVKKVALQARLKPGLLYGPKMPLRWQTAEEFDHDMVDRGAGVIVSDTRGFVYVITVPER